ncbi:HvfC/BufC N-terminal domain-containing protein [Legionella maioricensis]|uniref:DNA-binding domain-containing protein n=1 Tax=Legionella maioricensis TaxID=2896528 RepID=A0A9X2IBY1_9GAMM|nr:DNA-binding domain-containing protein [Legionella maioricensis]MCL9683842.1 DNA-binding domain-containing protein [Legionella maioricensis]MCL9686689.1 DNA-binding domain-containing protein [Legionella maioricensis]
MKQIQNDFYASVFDRKNCAIIPHIRKNQIAPELRFSVYRNTIMQNLAKALEITFPSVWKLVGQECANSLAFAFIRKEINLPETGCLDDWGGKFPGFLQTVNAIASLVYLKDIAQIEWLKHLSYCAANYRPLNPVFLQNMLDSRLEKLRLRFNPTVFLYSSPFFLKEILELVEHPTEKEDIALQVEPCYAVISRQHHQVLIHWVSQDLFDFLNYIKKRCTLTQSYEYMLQVNPTFDLIPALHFLIKNELLWKCG